MVFVVVLIDMFVVVAFVAVVVVDMFFDVVVFVAVVSVVVVVSVAVVMFVAVVMVVGISVVLVFNRIVDMFVVLVDKYQNLVLQPRFLRFVLLVRSLV